MRAYQQVWSGAAMAVLLGLSGASSAQTIGYNTRTGDVWVDNRLGEINDYGQRYRDPFIGEMTGYYGAPRPLIVDLLERRRWAPGDVYYACAIAHATRQPCVNVVREYDRHPGQGWGNVAKRMGIKPGSPAFHALKRGTVTTYDRWGYPITVNQNVRVDWSRHGPGKQGHGKHSGPDGHSSSHRDKDDHGKSGKGKSDNGKGKDKGKDNGKHR